jgi:uncharacterized OB-fold protein
MEVEGVEERILPELGEASAAASGIDLPFWEGLQRNELRMQRCLACGRWSWPPQWRCGPCGSWDFEWPVVAARGKVFSWTRTWHAFRPEMAGCVPFVTLLVELPDAGGRRLFGMLVGDDRNLRIGASVVGVSHRLSSGTVLRWRIGDSETSASVA